MFNRSAAMTDLPYRRINESGASPIVIICDHASNRVPAPYGDLGLPAVEFQRHIAWDIGAAGKALRARPDIVVGDNEPYRLDPRDDYSTPVHAMHRGLRHLQVEFRQDEVADAAGQQRWARLFGDCLEETLRTAR
jgi:predicted N-formylglutamate amidohydrolase